MEGLTHIQGKIAPRNIAPFCATVHVSSSYRFLQLGVIGPCIAKFTYFLYLGRYIPEGFVKKEVENKLPSRYDTQSAQSNSRGVG